MYQHVIAWREALERMGIALSVWWIRRRIGMSGGLLVHALLRETGRQFGPDLHRQMQELHASAYARYASQVRPLPGARDLLAQLDGLGAPWAVATSGRAESAAVALRLLELPPRVPVVTREAVTHAKPDPDLSVEAARRLGVEITDAVIVGDSPWDLLAARRARALGVDLLSGGDGREELGSRVRTGSTRIPAASSIISTRSVSLACANDDTG